MRRRTLLLTVAGIVLAGCSTAEPTEDGNESAADDEGDEDDDQKDTETESDDEDSSEADILEQFRSELEESGFDGIAVEMVDDGIELGYDATGTTEDDVAAEIELIADGYTTTIERGVSSTYLDAIAADPADGATLDSFAIEAEWVDAYLSDSLEWRELLTRIAETFVSEASPDDESDADLE